MTTLLASSTATNAAATEGNVKTFLDNLRTYIADLLGTDSDNKAAVAALLGSLLNGTTTKTTNYTVVAADRGKVIQCTGTLTINIAAAATLGDGFCFAIRNSGTGSVTVDPNLTETINGTTTVMVGAGDFVIVYCNGSNFSTVGGSSAPAGQVAHFAMSSPPAGWLKANGALVSRTTYANLFLAIGTTFGAGDGSTTFALPDLRGEFLRGLDDGRGVDSGRALGSSQAHQMQSHTHAVNGVGGTNASLGAASAGGSDYYYGQLSPALAGGTSNSGENRPRNVALLACIKF